MESVDDDNLDAVLESALISNSTNLGSSKVIWFKFLSLVLISV